MGKQALTSGTGPVCPADFPAEEPDRWIFGVAAPGQRIGHTADRRVIFHIAERDAVLTEGDRQRGQTHSGYRERQRHIRLVNKMKLIRPDTGANKINA